MHLLSETRFNIISIKEENDSELFTITSLLGERSLFKPTLSINSTINKYTEDDKEKDEMDENPKENKEVRGMEISGSNGLFERDSSNLIY